MKCINEYQRKFKAFIKNFLSERKNSAWTIGCSQHVYTPLKQYFDSPNQKVPSLTGLTIKQAIYKFVF